MRVVFDTNCLVASIPRKSPYRPVYESIRQGNISLAVTTEILEEYEEILSSFYSDTVGQNVLAQLLLLPKTELVTVFYNWLLIGQDPDDNKFADCAIAANVDYLVTNDRHYDVLKKTDFPKVSVIKLDRFMAMLR